MEQRIRKKVLLLSTQDTFGAYEYMYRMAKTMEKDFEIALAVLYSRKAEPWIVKIPLPSSKKPFIIRAINFLKRKLNIKKESLSTLDKYIFLPNEDESVNYVNADEILNRINFVPDIIISGMTDGFVNTSTLLELHKLTGAKVYQDTIDMGTLTGGCHVAWDCVGFKTQCNNCPAISNKAYKDFPSINLLIKKRNIQLGDFQLFTDRGWTLHQANSSAIYKNRIKIISSCIIDTNIFTNANRNIAKKIFGITEDFIIIFAGSNNAIDVRKGRQFLVEALSILWENMKCADREKVIILLAGNHNYEDELTSKIKFEKKLIDFISDDRLLSLAYQASNIFVSPSLEDGGPMMVAEALACGTPVVGFETGLLFNDFLVQNGVQGYRVKMKDSQGLAIAIEKIILLDNHEFQQMSVQARSQAIKCSSQQAFLNSIHDL